MTPLTIGDEMLLINAPLLEHSPPVHKEQHIPQLPVVPPLKPWTLVPTAKELLAQAVLKLGTVIKLWKRIPGIEHKVIAWKTFGRWNTLRVLRNELLES